ncbi:MAG TPA: hypothetical protein VMN58_09265 [Acidimicrobiales bacterium]|nr:hypothetical protein [Acidimicrobiales bacterium]
MIGRWTWDLATSEMTWSKEQYGILGLVDTTVGPSYEGFVRSAMERRDAVR